MRTLRPLATRRHTCRTFTARCAGALLAVLLPAGPCLGQTLFSDTFSDGSTSGWTRWGDIMHDSGTVFRNSCCNADCHYSIDAGGAWTDYTYSIDHLADDDDVSGITFRIQDSSNFYLLTQGFGDNDAWNLRLSKVVGGSPSNLVAPIDNQGGAAGQVNSENTWYEFKVELSGTSIKVYVDDVLKFDITDSTYATGTAGVWMEGQTAQCRFDNALVVASSTPLAMSSAADQYFYVGDAPTAMGTITITDSSAGSITAANDIRLRIPAGFNMTWDGSDTTAVIGGAAASKVSTAVTYEDSDATLVLNVTSDFAGDDVITVSGLSFAGFSAASSAANLEIEINDDDVVTATDDKTVEVNGPAYRSIGTNAGDLYSVGTASTTAGSAVVTFGGGATLPSNVGLGDKLTISGGAPSTLFSDDFSGGGLPEWSNIGADPLSESSGVLRNQTGGNADALCIIDAGAAWTDYTYSIDIYADDDDISGMAFRVSDSNNYYRVTQGFADNDGWWLRLSKVVGGSPSDLAPAIDNQGGAAGQVNSETTWYTFKVELNGTSIKVYIDNVLKFDVTDSTYSTGTAGAWTQDQTEYARFDNVLVTSSGGAGTGLYVFSRDSNTQVTLQSPAGSTLTDESYTFERCYNTLQDWEDDREGDLVGEGRREVGVCYNDGAFTDRLVISGSTTDAAHYMHLTVANGQRHNGLKDTGAVIDAQGGWGGLNAIDVEDEYTRVEWLEIKAIHDAGDGVFFDDSPAADNGVAAGIFVHSCWQNGNAGVRVGAQNVAIRNSMFTGGTTYGINLLANSSADIANCTVFGSPGSGNGISDGAGSTISVTNTISLNHDSGSDFQLWATISYFGYNMYSSVTGFDPDSYQGGNQLPPANLEHLFESTAGGSLDLHLETTGHRAGNLGVDLSADFTGDIDGQTRTGSWDMGADEGVSGPSPLPPKVLAWEEIPPQP